jgi:hypothetical protein
MAPWIVVWHVCFGGMTGIPSQGCTQGLSSVAITAARVDCLAARPAGPPALVVVVPTDRVMHRVLADARANLSRMRGERRTE